VHRVYRFSPLIGLPCPRQSLTVHLKFRQRECAVTPTFSIRAEHPADRAAIHAVVAAAFGQPDEADLVDSLRYGGHAVVSLVAEEDSGVVGHVMLSAMQAPFRALGLAPVSVTPDRQSAGVGSALIIEAIRLAREASYAAVFVLGDQAYYSRFGFDVDAATGFASPYAGAHFAVLALEPLPVTTGAVAYAPAFEPL
jgi:putative acetyltransferase